jgi:hypothetical protein
VSFARRGLGLAAIVLLAACPARRRAGGDAAVASGPLLLHQVEARDRTAPGARIAGITDADLGRWLRARISRSAALRLVEKPTRGSYRLTLELGLGVREDDDPPSRVVLASARAVVPGEPEGLVLQASTVAPFKPAGKGAPEQKALRTVVEGVADDLVFQAEAALAPEGKLVTLLRKTKDVSRLAAAVEIAAFRRLRGTVPPLCELLGREEKEVADRAIGALVAIGDRRAVKPLTRVAKTFRDTAQMAKVLDAIGTLGGQEARDYLEFVASGHDDADIRNLASEALERMNRAEKRPKK